MNGLRLAVVLLLMPAAAVIVAGPSQAAPRVDARTLSVHLASTTAAADDAVALTGRLTRSPQRSAVYVERLTGARWIRLTTVHTRARGTFRSSVSNPGPGVYAYRMRAARQGRRAAVTSRVVRLSSPSSIVPATPSVPVLTPTTLAVDLVDVPAGVSPDVVITAPDGSAQVVHGSTQIDPAAAGTWRVVARSIVVPGGTGYAVTPQQSVDVAPNDRSTLTVDYRVVVPDTTHVVDPAAVTELAATSDGKRVVTLPSTGDLHTGDVLTVGVGPQTPYGLLGKVSSVGQHQVTVDTAGVTLMDAVDNGVIDMSAALGSGDVVDPGSPSPDPIATPLLRRLVARTPTADTGLTQDLRRNFSCDAQLSAVVGGSVEINPTMQFSADWNLVDRVRSAEATAELTETAQLKATFDVTNKKGAKPATCTLSRTALLQTPITFRPITFTVGAVPVVIVPQLQFYLDGAAHLEVDAEVGLQQQLTATGGVRYDKATGFSPVSSLNNTVGPIGPSFTGEADADAGVAPELSLLLYGVGGPRVYIRGSLAADAHASGGVLPDGVHGTLAWNLDAWLRAKAAFDIDVLDLHSAELTLFEKKFDLLSGTLQYTPAAGATITTTSLPDATVGETYDQQLGTADHRNGTWSISSGVLPGGLRLTGDRIIGAPTGAGVSTVTIAFTDPYRKTTQQQLTLTVNTPPVFTPTVTRISVSQDGDQADGESHRPSLSGNGQWVVFDSDATDLVPGDTNASTDVFLENRLTGAITRMSTSSSGGQADGASFDPSISDDGRYIAFTSAADDLAPQDINNRTDVFLKDVETGLTTRISSSSTGQGADSSSNEPSISADGRYVAFSSSADNLASVDTNGVPDVFVKDTTTGSVSWVSTSASGRGGNNISGSASISADGRWIAFESYATDLTTEGTDGTVEVFRKDIQTGDVTLVSSAANGARADGGSYNPSISSDGGVVAFYTLAGNLAANDTNNAADVYAKDEGTGAVTRISTDSTGVGGDIESTDPSISGDGRFVSFTSWAHHLVTDDDNGRVDIFVKDQQTGRTIRVSTSESGTQSSGDSIQPSMSRNGRVVAFSSWAPNLVPGDTNGLYDVFATGFR